MLLYSLKCRHVRARMLNKNCLTGPLAEGKCNLRCKDCVGRILHMDPGDTLLITGGASEPCCVETLLRHLLSRITNILF